MPKPPLRVLRAALQTYLEGESGVSFEALSALAEPLFAGYAIDPRAPLDQGPAWREAVEVATIVAVYDTARLFWAYFGLDPLERLRKRAALETALLGAPPTPADRPALEALFEAMEAQWRRLTAVRPPEAALVPGYRLPPFSLLLAQYAGAPTAPPPRFGPKALDLPHALALFAQPLLGGDVQRDPERLSEAMLRAYTYWQMALLPIVQRPARLAALARRLGLPPDDPALRAEAERMLRRFFELFPERFPGPPGLPLLP